ncbi:cytochrome c oxidase assembly factor 6 homolog [Denticeps clupeoides]|uniref:COA6 factor n=1 Tax=Denticeps clupeoides TaxID=299321 RepID=A0AAY4C2Q9_9TELE|nr:cytochrome c oxidase assembly factor 6 homolog [Denticeps clupeoides]XP_028810997.1 cytochrome c oxidase assembly factor 6 homolog [Denticeps clupeoides]XP_028810998.1 cytochrome c oxidase assembly factor 6 homolog [Denticeps clupeoides]
MSAPNKEQRRACWAARDDLWKCLDGGQDDAEACRPFQQRFESSCPAQWVRYFVKRRDFLKYKEQLQAAGYEYAEGPAKT